MAIKTAFADKFAPASKQTGRLHHIVKEIDFTNTDYNLTSSDSLDIFKVPANSIVYSVWVVVITAQGATCTADIGITGSETLFISNANLNSADAMTTSANSVTVPSHYFSAAGTIGLYADHTIDAAKIVCGMVIGVSHKNLT